MTQIQIEEKRKIFGALEEYAKKHGANFYCVILTPEEGERATVSQPTSQNVSVAARGEAGVIIEKIVDKEVLSQPIER